MGLVALALAVGSCAAWQAPRRPWPCDARGRGVVVGAAAKGKGFGAAPAPRRGGGKKVAAVSAEAPKKAQKKEAAARPGEAAETPALWPLRVLHADGAGTARAFGLSAAAIGWDLDAPPAVAVPVEGVPEAFLLRGALTAGECRRLVDLAERAGFEDPPAADRDGGDGDRDQLNGAVSCALDLSVVFDRCRGAFPERVLAYRYGGGADRYERFDEDAPRRLCPGAPEGAYELSGLNPKGRFYRYRPGSRDVFRPHRDDVWPGSSLVRTSEDGVHPFDAVAEDGWAYADDHKSPWAFKRGVDRVSHLTMLLYLNDDFEGGNTTFFDDDGLPPVGVKPERGSALCFWQSFKLGRPSFRCRDSAYAHLHEGSPVHARSKSPKYAVRTEVLYTFPDQGEPPA